MEELKARVKELEQFSNRIQSETVRNTASIKSLWHKVDCLETIEKNIMSICQDMREMFTELKYLRNDTNDLKKDLEDIKSRDGRQWRNLIGGLMLLVLSALIGKYLI